ncbi:MAG: serine/threonine-protein kinase RsbW [Clostridia bacterium]|nr:serine/threonine-protein kinase RsbW [Clostridia bacterium]
MALKAALQASLRLRGGSGSEKVAMAAAAAAGRLAGLSPYRLEDVQTAVAEACLNAFEHGNAGHAGATVYLDFIVHRGGLKVVVRDRGPGFQPAVRPRPDLRQQLVSPLPCRGWGWFLIERLTDRVQVQVGNIGCTVVLYFNLKKEVAAP